jgi:thiol-disulfide isomerase/thioredoxin
VPLSTSRREFVLIGLAGGLLTSCKSSSTASAASAAERKVAANFTLWDANGNPVRLSAYKGKVVLLNFWATWCGPCKVEIPWFIEFEKKHQDGGFAVLGVSMDDGGCP